jgi:phosphoribosylamine--glycine ligase
MKVLLIGSGGREHTLAWKLAQSELVNEVIAAPGNIGISGEPKCKSVNVSSEDIPGLLNLATSEKIDLTVVGPEAPLCLGLADAFASRGLKVFGPSSKAAMLEGSKVFSKTLMQKYSIPTANFEVFDNFDKARALLSTCLFPTVIKADGLAAGKGVFVCKDRTEAYEALDSIMNRRMFGIAGDRVIIEECLEGEEASFIAFSDGNSVVPLAGSQDHKAVYDDDKGPNTGGMGAYSPAPVITETLHEKIMNDIMIPTVRALESEGAPFVGFLYAGLMIRNDEVKVLEYNVRLGDPEAQPLLFRMKSDPVPLMLAALERRLGGMTIEWMDEDSVCVVMASKGYPGAYEKGLEITGIRRAEEIEDVKVFIAGAQKKNGMLVTSGGRVLGVTARSKGIGSAISKAYQAVTLIKWDGVHFRNDIGKKALGR